MEMTGGVAREAAQGPLAPETDGRTAHARGRSPRQTQDNRRVASLSKEER